MRKFWLTILSVLSATFTLQATHIIGGELYYDCLGGNQYRITLKVYRDCFNGQAPFDNPAHVTIFNGNGGFLQVIDIPFPGSTNVPFISGNPCFQAPPNVCVEQAIYTTVVTLPASPSGYVFAYQRCCRNNTILNLVDPGNTGATYTETVPPTSSVVCNSSPRFTNFPPIALCIGEELVFDHSATDPDGDSLVYELCSTYSGATPSDPNPPVTSTPPFNNIIFSAPYNAGNPIASNPPISIDPQTGVLTVTPTQLGQYVVGVCVREYRNGVLIGTHSRDFQFNVTNCLTNVVADVELPSYFTPGPNGAYYSCNGLTVPFDNQSVNGWYYAWNFGDPATTNDTSSLATPTYTYNDSGFYTVRLIANPGYFCADTDYVTLFVKEGVDIDFTYPAGQCIDGNSFNFNTTGQFDNGTNFSWNFGPNSNPGTSTSLNPTGISYNAPGIYEVVLAAEDQGCTDTARHSVTVYGHITADWDSDREGCVPHLAQFTTTIDSAYNHVVFAWNFGNGQTSSAVNPSTIYANTGTYSVDMMVYSTTGCRDTIIINRPNWITIYPVPQAGFSVEPTVQTIFTPNFWFFDESSLNVSCMLYFDNGDSSDDCTTFYSYADTGHYNVMQIVYNSFGCPDTAIVPIVVTPEFTFYIPNTFTPNGDGLNEGFRGRGIGIMEYQFRIYDRWGGVIFFTEDQMAEWNGRYNNTGDKVPPDIYVYAVDLTDVFGEKHKYRGKVLLVRPTNY